MTFIDVSGGRPTAGLIAGYSILCVVSFLCTLWAINTGRTRLHYRSFFSVRVLFPIATCILALENAALAATGHIYDNYVEDGNNDSLDGNLFLKAVFVLQTFEVPILLIVVFEITYLVHKRRSVNFCGLYFDEGVRVNNNVLMSFMLRNSIRTLALLLLIMGLIANFNVLITEDPLAGRAGWWALSQEDWDNIHLLLSLIPTAVLTLVSFYLSIMLWRYGTESAMVVHSSMCNPWFYLFFGTLAMFVGQLFGEELYTVMSNLGILIFIITILLLMAEVDKDIVKSNDEACFLVQVAQIGDQIRVASSADTRQQQQQIIESNFHDEESPIASNDNNAGVQNDTSITNNQTDEKNASAISAAHPVIPTSEDVEKTNEAEVQLDSTTGQKEDQEVVTDSNDKKGN